MRKTIIMTSAALIFTGTTTFAQVKEPTDTIQVYFINHQIIKNFTGAELIGKTIKNYRILPSTYKDNDGRGKQHVLLLHEIITDEVAAGKNYNYKKPLVFIDGILNANGVNAVKPTDIKSMTIIKDPKLLSVYTQMGLKQSALQNGIIRIVTTKQKEDPIIYIVDGVEMTYSEVMKIPSDKIESMNLYKRGNEHKYVKEYGKKKDIVEIKTK